MAIRTFWPWTPMTALRFGAAVRAVMRCTAPVCTPNQPPWSSPRLRTSASHLFAFSTALKSANALRILKTTKSLNVPTGTTGTSEPALVQCGEHDFLMITGRNASVRRISVEASIWSRNLSCSGSVVPFVTSAGELAAWHVTETGSCISVRYTTIDATCCRFVRFLPVSSSLEHYLVSCCTSLRQQASWRRRGSANASPRVSPMLAP